MTRLSKPSPDDPGFRSWVMSRVRSKGTKPEWVVRRLLFRMGYRYRLHDKSLPGCPDIVFSARHRLILVHGCFWHGHECKNGTRLPKSNREFWETKRLQNMKRDKVALQAVTTMGWKVLVIWECEVNAFDMVTRLQAFLEEPKG